jgi:uncharacterized LabA/DUF88 family protein
MTQEVQIRQSVAILVDGNNIERSLQTMTNHKGAMINFDTLIPRLLAERALTRLVYFREGRHISEKLADRLHNFYYGTVIPCHKSADIPLTIYATQIADKVDTIIILSGDSDFIDLVRHLKAQGVRVEIASVYDTTSDLLMQESDFYHQIDEEDCFILKTGGASSGGNRKRGSTRR